MIFRTTSLIVLKQNSTANPSAIIFFDKYGLTVMMLQIFTRKIPSAGSNYSCWLVISTDSVFKNDEN